MRDKFEAVVKELTAMVGEMNRAVVKSTLTPRQVYRWKNVLNEAEVKLEGMLPVKRKD